MGFTGAGVIISNSYSAWQESPVATSITTHPIAELDFPTVTVCPPKGSNTALNYDLMKADNNSLTEENRERLKEAVYDIITVPSHMEYISSMMASANPDNVQHVYDGYQSVPRPYRDSGFEIETWKNYGTLQTPWYGATIREDYYSRDKHHHVVLQLPVNIGELVGSGTLVIELEVDTREEEGWQEEVVYSASSLVSYQNNSISKHKLMLREFIKGKSLHEMSWEDAEAHCQMHGGHLTSILTEEEQQEVIKVADGKHAWIGGRDPSVKGVWQWSDGSAWNYSTFINSWGNGGVNKDCVLITKSTTDWLDWKCNVFLNFICKAEPKRMKGNQTLTLAYNKDEINFPAFHVWYNYEKSSQQQIKSMEHKTMTGFRLKWRIHNPPLEVIFSEFGRSAKTPILEGDRSNELEGVDIISLLIPQTLSEEVGNGSLVIQMEVGGQEENWEKQVFYTTASWGQAKYKFYNEEKTWMEAEASCRKEGGHLTSVVTEEESVEILKVIRLGTPIWVGGSDQDKEGVWTWADGLPWNYTNWSELATDSSEPQPNGGYLENCIKLTVTEGVWTWADRPCRDTLPYVCKSDIQAVQENTSLTLEYTPEQLTFSTFLVWCHYKYYGQGITDAVRHKRRKGVWLNWYHNHSNGSGLTEYVIDTPVEWNPVAKYGPMYEEYYLIRMVKFASLARSLNVSQEDIIKRFIKEKENFIKSENFKLQSMCSGGKIRFTFYPTLFDNLFGDSNRISNKGKDKSNNIFNDIIKLLDSDGPLTNGIDITTGFEIFSALTDCSESVALSKFLHRLLSNKSPRTIIQAIINTIQYNTIREKLNRKKINQFYQSLAKIFNLQYGNILLATNNPSQIQKIIFDELPFFSNYSQDIDSCLRGEDCKEVEQMLGRWKHTIDG